MYTTCCGQASRCLTMASRRAYCTTADASLAQSKNVYALNIGAALVAWWKDL
jgi:hypothetical protein